MKIRDLINLAAEAFDEWNNKNISLLAASLAYYAIFSLTPLLIISISVFGYFYGGAQVKQEALEYFTTFLGVGAAESVKAMLENMGTPDSGLFATFFGLCVLVYASTSIFFNARRALNTIWDFTPERGKGLIYLLRSRMLSFALVMGVGMLLLSSALVNALVPSFFYHHPLARFMNFLFTLMFVGLLFSILYVLLPSVRLPFSDVLAGSILASFLFNLGNLFVGLYLHYLDMASIYGAGGSLVLILVWVYYSAQIFLYGAVYTKKYSERFGSRSNEII
ncbi:MAG: ribonuclease BN [Candidatus Altiarchaeales archaeon ex4484_96]|nr:MAG: ribonuclease BN [Candidatus Altiarchaeales archaeon ex4484_96]